MTKKKKRYQEIQQHASSHKEAKDPVLYDDPKKFDPKATTKQLLEDLRRLQEEHPQKFISRNFYRTHGGYSESTWTAKFGTFREYRRQAGLEPSRGQQEIERQIAKHASLDVYRGFYEVEVMPWVGKYQKDTKGRWKTLVVASDFHDKECDEFALDVFLDTCRRIQPDVVCLAGDILDAYEFSRFDKDPRQCDAAGRIKWAREHIFKALRNVCPKSQIDLVLGNHEQRVLRIFSERTPYLREILSDFMGLSMADLFGIRDYEINMVSKWDLAAYKVSDLRAQVQKNYKTYWNSVTVCHYPDPGFRFGTNWVAGHTHRPELKTASKIGHLGPMPLWGFTNGCMAKIDTEYNGGIDTAQNSFLIVHVDTETLQAIPEPILFSDYGAIVGGQFYRRKGVK